MKRELDKTVDSTLISQVNLQNWKKYPAKMQT